MSFAPFGAESNTSSYLEWAIPMGNISVRVIRAEVGYN